MEERKNLYEKLSEVQNELKAPKSQNNTFGNFKYRSCEDILEASKPILKKNRLSLVINDTLENIGDRYYIKATAILFDLDSDSKISNNAYAREEETKKGMDGSQITGTSSSYARKYALNGLFNIDDTKDADTDEYGKTISKKESKSNNQFENATNDDNYETILNSKFNSKLIESESDLDKVLESYKLSDYSAMTNEQKEQAIKVFDIKIKKNKNVKKEIF